MIGLGRRKPVKKRRFVTKETQPKATVTLDSKRDITVYFINGKFDQLSHMKSGKLDFLSRILCHFRYFVFLSFVVLDVMTFPDYVVFVVLLFRCKDL